MPKKYSLLFVVIEDAEKKSVAAAAPVAPDIAVAAAVAAIGVLIRMDIVFSCLECWTPIFFEIFKDL